MTKQVSLVLARVLLTALVLGFGCKNGLSAPPAPWDQMGLPIGDGVITDASSSRLLYVHYAKGAAAEPLFTRYQAAFLAAGYVPGYEPSRSKMGPGGAGGAHVEQRLVKDGKGLRLDVAENPKRTAVALSFD